MTSGWVGLCVCVCVRSSSHARNNPITKQYFDFCCNWQRNPSEKLQIINKDITHERWLHIWVQMHGWCPFTSSVLTCELLLAFCSSRKLARTFDFSSQRWSFDTCSCSAPLSSKKFRTTVLIQDVAGFMAKKFLCLAEVWCISKELWVNVTFALQRNFRGGLPPPLSNIPEFIMS